MRFVTRRNAAVDRIACPWLIRRFIDPDAEFLYVEPQDVARVAMETSAVPFVVDGADVQADVDLTPEAAGLKAIAMGFRKMFGDRDLDKLAAEMPIYDALYTWCRQETMN